MQKKGKGQQDLLERLQERLGRVEAHLANVRRRIANLNEQLETETDDEDRKELAERKAQRIKTRQELEAEYTSLIAQLEQQPLSPTGIQHITELSAWITCEGQKAMPEKKREVYELVRLQARLAVKDGYKVAHVSSIVGDKTLQVASYK